ncbi:hypothetical protein PoB_006621700 [Plakobranchus ocellatus]|uniref:Uncharacterized protein n=1 Tax=Plakobranchus ocellatus TaxID=259542 RepID=A0AAV4D6H3_9GAST|nr:hypothetical protein PoB_006621700 [Plakobranchus ocellatus]
MCGHLKEIVKSQNLCNLVSKGEKTKQFTKFQYLDYLKISDRRCPSETTTMAKDTFQKHEAVQANRNIRMEIKIRVMKTCMVSIECCRINNETEKNGNSRRDLSEE